MPKSLEEAEKRKCEKEDCTTFMGIYFTEYKRNGQFLFCDNAHCHNGRVLWLLERSYPSKGYEFLQYEIRIQLSTQNRSHIAAVLEQKTFLAFQFPWSHPPLTFFFPNGDKDPLIEKPLFLFSWWVDGRSYNYLVSLNCYW